MAVARKLTVLCWHVLTKEQDYLWARPALIANKNRAMELQAGRPQQKGNRRGSAYAYNVKALRDQELELAKRAERNYARFVKSLENASAERRGARAPQSGKERIGRLAALAADTPRFATRSLTRPKNSTPAQKPLVHLIRRKCRKAKCRHHLLDSTRRIYKSNNLSI